MSHDVQAPQRMFQMITGYWVSQMVGTIAEIGAIDGLVERADTAEGLAARLGVDASALARLLRAAAGVGLVARDAEDRWAPTPLGQTLRANVPGSMRDMAIMQTSTAHWQTWGRFREAVRSGVRQTKAALGTELFDYYDANPREAAAFSGAMSGMSALVAREVAERIDTRSARVVVDVGGATGTLLQAMLGANDELTGILFELPHVAQGAREALAAAGLAGRCDVVSGDFFQGVPQGDLYMLKHVLHDWSDEQATTILTNVAKAMRPGARVLLVEMVIPEDDRPSVAPLMDLNMLALLPGRERTQAEYESLLASAGLRLRRVVETRSPFHVLEAGHATAAEQGRLVP